VVIAIVFGRKRGLNKWKSSLYFVKTVRRMLSDRCLPVCLSVCPVLSVTLWPNGWTNQDETSRAGRSRPWPHCIRWGPRSSSPKGAQPPVFAPYLLWPNGSMDQDATWYGGSPRPKRHCLRWLMSFFVSAACILRHGVAGSAMWSFKKWSASQFRMHMMSVLVGRSRCTRRTLTTSGVTRNERCPRRTRSWNRRPLCSTISKRSRNGYRTVRCLCSDLRLSLHSAAN